MHKCLDSVANQTLKEIEIICINDASPDNSAHILEEYAQKDSRIKIITFEKNRGVAVARNVGIEQAQGEYIGFVDSDDYVDLDFFEKLYIHAKNTGAELVKALLKEISDGIVKSYNMDIKLSDKSVVFTGLFSSAIYKKTLINEFKIKFTELTFCEDRLFPFLASFYANKVETINDTFYNYIRRKGQSNDYWLDKKKIESLFYFLSQVFYFINKNIQNFNDYTVLAQYFVLEAILYIRRAEEDCMEFIVGKVLFLSGFVENKYKEFVYSKIEIKKFLEYLKSVQNSKIFNRKEITKNIIITLFRKYHAKRLNISYNSGI